MQNQISLRLNTADLTRLRIIAEDHHCTVSALIRSAIRIELTNHSTLTHTMESQHDNPSQSQAASV